MNTAILVIVFIVALILALGFLILVLSLVPAISQLKSLLVDMERTSAEIRELSREFRKLGLSVEEKLDKADVVLDVSKRTVENAGEALHFLNQNLFRRSASLFALVPAIRFGWKMVKKIRGGR
jgi:predicted PurR-regulated permease PerM